MTADMLAMVEEPIERNQRWKSKDGRTLRVMGIVDRYVVYRFKGSGASLLYETDFRKRFTLEKK